MCENCRLDEIFLVSSNNPLRYYRILPVTTRSFFRGHPIIQTDEGWVYEDNGEPAGFDGTIRPCKKCGLIFDGSDAGHPDPCLGNLPGVDNACCGHGVRSEAYIRFANGVVIRGFEIDRQRVAQGEAMMEGPKTIYLNPVKARIGFYSAHETPVPSNIKYTRADLTDALVEAAEEVIKSATGAYNEKRTNVSKDKFRKLKDALAAYRGEVNG